VTVAELIEELRTLPPDLPVGYVNECADDGARFVSVECPEVSGWGRYGSQYHAPDGMPVACVLL
jgi:hypothetical protein